MMEGDYHVGQVLDTLKELKIDDNTIVVFASDNGPWAGSDANLGNLGSPDMGNAGPFRGELGEATEGAIRTFCFIRWPGHIAPNTTSYAMFSEMDFLPTFAAILGAKLPTDRPIDGVDQTAVLFGKSETGARDVAAHLHRPGSGGSTMEAMAYLLQGHAPDAAPGQQMLGGHVRTASARCTSRRSTTSRWIRTRI